MRISGPAWLAGVILLLPGIVSAEPEFHVQRHPDRTVKTGENVDLNITATWKTNEGDYRFTAPLLTLENLSVEESGETNETFQEGGEERRKKIFRFKLRSLQTGRGVIRPLRLGYLDLQTNQSGHLEMNEIEFPIVPDRSRLYQILGGAGAVSLLGIGAGWLYAVRIRNKRTSEGYPAPRLEDPYLSQLADSPEKISETGKVFRTYLKEKFSLGAETATNRQMMTALEKQLSQEELKKLKKIFDKLDEHLFGQSQDSRVERHKLHEEIVRFVEGKRII